eukprot:CAMPEP_0184683028 /NCGR_PEP_ID=MMETSP0312-20130426/9665_1 /TAXON_ID=31354 /ORGANISM="Compsopogon coeruleus, Strain SAG 36.94" /LENGTH=40 /DNA_ID= /DNA_START= /DNA_END= /DNA_ORIENTATION=
MDQLLADLEGDMFDGPADGNVPMADFDYGYLDDTSNGDGG